GLLLFGQHSNGLCLSPEDDLSPTDGLIGFLCAYYRRRAYTETYTKIEEKRIPGRNVGVDSRLDRQNGRKSYESAGHRQHEACLPRHEEPEAEDDNGAKRTPIPADPEPVWTL